MLLGTSVQTRMNFLEKKGKITINPSHIHTLPQVINLIKTKNRTLLKSVSISNLDTKRIP